MGSRWAWEAGSLPNLAVPAASCAALRTVKRLTGLSFHRLIGASADELDTYLRRERAKGRPVTYLHMAVHAGPAGVDLAGRGFPARRIPGMHDDPGVVARRHGGDDGAGYT